MQKIGKPEPLVTYDEIMKAYLLIEPGDCILTRENYRLTNLFIPGHWSHAAMYVGNYDIVEAIGTGVRKVNLFEMLLKKDEFVILRPSWLQRGEREFAAMEAKSYVGIDYDYYFDTNKALYCSELVYQAYKEVGSIRPPLKRMRTFGVYNINPDHFAESTSMQMISYGGKS